MKKLINTNLVSSLIFSSALLICFAKTDSFGQKISGWKQSDLRGRVKSVSLCTYEASEKFGEVVKGDKQANSEVVIKFDISGNFLEKEYYGETNNLGLLQKLRTVYSYSADGHVLESNTFLNDNLFRKTIYKCDIKGNITEEAIYNHVGDVEEKTIFKYDQSGNKIESTNNIKGTEIIHKYKYDLKGNPIEDEAYFGDIKVGSARTKYDTNGNLSETSAQTYDGITVIETYKYTFDEKGNYISKTIYKSSSYPERNINNIAKAEQIIERVIEYF